MNHTINKVDWCLKKALKEIAESGKHRGLVRIKPDLGKARLHIEKAEHYLRATDYLKKGKFSDIGTSTIFYSIYHCLLAIAAKFGYESRNQECTFILIHSLIESGKIAFNKNLINKIASLNTEDKETIVNIRERYQYGTYFSIKDDIYTELFELAKETISKTKVIIEMN